MDVEPGYVIDQVVRREQYEAAHPEVEITFDRPFWKAAVPGRDHITRSTLEMLLDTLEAPGLEESQIIMTDEKPAPQPQHVHQWTPISRGPGGTIYGCPCGEQKIG